MKISPVKFSSGGTARSSISRESLGDDSREHGTESADFISTVVAWLTFHAVALWTSISYWLRFKRICVWHTPKPIRMGGNPFARKVTHGICPECFARVSGEIASHEPELRSRAG